jgi:hypothetical protein
VEERIVERADKKLLLDQMVNRDPTTAAVAAMKQLDAEGKSGGGLSAMDLLADIKFGCNAVFDSSQSNDLPTDDEISAITDRTRTESDSKGRLRGNETKNAAGFDANKALSDTQAFGGLDFRKLRNERSKMEEKETPKNLRGIAHLWKEVAAMQSMNKKREVKHRIIQVKGNGSGWGSAMVPVLASNNYTLEMGESSVFQRELSHRPSAAKAAAVPDKKKKPKAMLLHQDVCQFCGEGGKLVLCSMCPIAAHEACCGNVIPKTQWKCEHHRCGGCGRNGAQGGGILFLCQACPNAYCEDCVPSLDQPGVRILGECDRFEDLGFDSTKKGACVYIHCSKICENTSIREFGWDPAKLYLKSDCPPAVDVSHNFGTKTAILEELTTAEEVTRAPQISEKPTEPSSLVPASDLTEAMVGSMTSWTRLQYLTHWGCPTPRSRDERGREMIKYIRSVSHYSSASSEVDVIDLISDSASDDLTSLPPTSDIASGAKAAVPATATATYFHSAVVSTTSRQGLGVATSARSETIDLMSSDSEG